MVSKSAVNTQCIHHWDVGYPHDGIVHCVCKLCRAEKVLPAFGGREIKQNVHHRHGNETTGFNKRTIQEFDMRDVHVESEESIVKIRLTKEVLNACKDEIIVSWEKNKHNTSKTALELGIHHSTLCSKLQQWGLIPYSPSRKPRVYKGKPTNIVGNRKSTVIKHYARKDEVELASIVRGTTELQLQLKTELDNAMQTVCLLKKYTESISTTIKMLMKEGGDVK